MRILLLILSLTTVGFSAKAQYPSQKQTKNIKVDGKPYIYVNPESMKTRPPSNPASIPDRPVTTNTQKTRSAPSVYVPSQQRLQEIRNAYQALADSVTEFMKRGHSLLLTAIEKEDYQGILNNDRYEGYFYNYGLRRYKEIDTYQLLPPLDSAVKFPDHPDTHLLSLVAEYETGLYEDVIFSYKATWMPHKGKVEAEFYNKKVPEPGSMYWAYNPIPDTLSQQGLYKRLVGDFTFIKALIKTGDVQKADVLLTRAIQTANNSRLNWTNTKAEAGLVCFMLGKYSVGIELFEQGLPGIPGKKKQSLVNAFNWYREKNTSINEVENFFARHKELLPVKTEPDAIDLANLLKNGKYVEGISYYDKKFAAAGITDSVYFNDETKFAELNQWLTFVILSGDEAKRTEMMERISRQFLAYFQRYTKRDDEDLLRKTKEVPEVWRNNEKELKRYMLSAESQHYFHAADNKARLICGLIPTALLETKSYKLINDILTPYKEIFQDYKEEDIRKGLYGNARNWWFSQKLTRLQDEAGFTFRFARKARFTRY